MQNLFSDIENEAKMRVAPLARRMRPRTLDEFVGQADVVGAGSWLRRAIETDTLTSIILYGPAGTGKTSLAHVVAHTTHAQFVEVSAIGGTVADLRREIKAAERRLIDAGTRTILFVDEIHRFSRSQQDALLHAVEDRTVVLIGATTENPYFEVNTALNSRSRIIQLHALNDKEIGELLDRALSDECGLAGVFSLSPKARDQIIMLSGGDARSALNTLELASNMKRNVKAISTREAIADDVDKKNTGTDEAIAEDTVKKGTVADITGEAKGTNKCSVKSNSDTSQDNNTAKLTIDIEDVSAVAPHTQLSYDKNKDQHYDIISAFIKSMRGSDPDAALYWLARMIDGGEDPKFIARRIFILASEDIGNADPQALLIAQAAFKSVEVIGYPECRINLAQAAVYMALAPKSNAAEAGIDAALREVRSGPARAVPDYLRDRHRPGAESYGEYKYPHNYPSGWVDQRYLPEGLERGCFYKPSERGWEAYRANATKRDRG